MWRRKTPEELRKTAREGFRIGLFILVIYFGLFQFICSFCEKFIGTDLNEGKFNGGHIGRKLTWTELYNKQSTYFTDSVLLLICFLVIGGILFLFSKDKSTVMCDKCHQSKIDDNAYNCECGGEFVNFNKMIDDDKETKSVFIQDVIQKDNLERLISIEKDNEDKCFYRKCSLCGELTEIKNVSIMYCSNCNFKFDNSFVDWKRHNNDKSFNDYILEFAYRKEKFSLLKWIKRKD